MVPEKAVVVTKKWRRKFCSGITKSESVSGISSINNIVLPLCQTYEEAQTIIVVSQPSFGHSKLMWAIAGSIFI